MDESIRDNAACECQGEGWFDERCERERRETGKVNLKVRQQAAAATVILCVGCLAS